MYYSDGPIEAKVFRGCVDPSKREFGGVQDKFYTYPANQRNWVFDTGDGKDSGPITFVSKDGIEMTVSGVANFQLNTDCAALQKFHELIGNRYEAYTPDEARESRLKATVVI